MKTVRKLAAIVLVGAMALSIAACKKGAKKVSADDFKKACEEVALKKHGADRVPTVLWKQITSSLRTNPRPKKNSKCTRIWKIPSRLWVLTLK